jgi:hypothetical protein
MKYRVLFLLLFAGCLSTNAAVRVTGMKVSGLVAPLGIDETPTFSWQTESDERGFQQQSYAITVTDASGKKVWQSGVVTSDAQSNIRYEGMPLRSRAAYRWTVRIAGTKGEVSKVAASTFETAFLDASEWKAEWIGGERSAAVPYYGTHFEVGKKKVVRARIYATALGVFTMKVNGAAVTENQLDKAVKQTGVRTVAIGGGVSANSGVRDAVSDYCRRRELKAFIPPRLFTNDNAAMVAIAGYYKYIDRIFCRYDQVPYARVGV